MWASSVSLTRVFDSSYHHFSYWMVKRKALCDSFEVVMWTAKDFYSTSLRICNGMYLCTCSDWEMSERIYFINSIFWNSHGSHKCYRFQSKLTVEKKTSQNRQQEAWALLAQKRKAKRKQTEKTQIYKMIVIVCALDYNSFALNSKWRLGYEMRAVYYLRF